MLVGFFYYDQNNQKTLLVTNQSEHKILRVLRGVHKTLCRQFLQPDQKTLDLPRVPCIKCGGFSGSSTMSTNKRNTSQSTTTPVIEHGLIGVLQDVILDVCGSQPFVIWRRDRLEHRISLVQPRQTHLRRLW